MTKLMRESALELAAGNFLSSAAINAFATYLGGPLAAAIPSLVDSLASRRHQERVAAAIADISECLSRQEEKIRSLTDEQYKLANELYLALLQTTHTTKIEYLKTAIKRTVDITDIGTQEAAVLSRIIRDISVNEVEFITKTFHYKHICTRAPDPNDTEKNIYCVAHDGKESILVTGLIALGILTPGTMTLSGGSNLYFSTITAKLLTILQA